MRFSGCDLQALLSAAHARGEALSPALVAHLGIEACRGLARLHRRGLIHGAVTPGTLVLSAGGEVKLADRSLGASPWYLAPEQARREYLDRRTDLYSLGLVLYEASRGRRARQADERAAFQQALCDEPLHAEGPLAETLVRATRPAREDRFADAHEMRAALEIDLALLGRPQGDLATELSALLRAWGMLAPGEQLPGVAAEPTTFLSIETERPFPTTALAALLGSAAGLALVVLLLLAGLSPTRRADARTGAPIRCSVLGAQPSCASCPEGDGVYSGRRLNEATEGITLPEDAQFACRAGLIIPR